jgi:GxxExxY protein
MNTDQLLFRQLTYSIRGAIFQVYNTLGFGHKEGIYQKALEIEFGKRGINFETEPSLNVLYVDQPVGIYRPDFVIDEKVIVEIKAAPFLSRQNEVQLVYYLKGTGYNLGLLINFGSKKLEIRRKIWTGYPRKSVIRKP